MKNNRGFTMIEILVVIAILGIVTGGVTIGFNFMRNANVGSVAEEIDSDLSKIRLQNMTKSDRVYMHIRVKDGDYYKSYNKNQTIDASDEYGNKIGSNSVSIYYVLGSTETEITSNLTISFNRKGEVQFYKDDGATSISVDYLKITNGDNTKKLTITETGKHFIE